MEEDQEPKPLSEKPEAIVEKAMEISKQQPVLFYGKSSVYAKCKKWPKDDHLKPVAILLNLDAQKFFD